MKKSAILILLFIAQITIAQEQKKEIKVDNVTVYLRGAKVTGTTKVNLQKGRNVIRLVDLPMDLDENTYRINLDKSAALLSISPATKVPDEKDITSEENSLTDDSNKLNREINLLNIQINTLNGEKNIINSNLHVIQNDRISPQEQLIKLTEFYAKRILEIENLLFVLNEQKSELSGQNTKIQQQITEIQTKRISPKKELLLEIQAEYAHPMDLGLTYVVSNAGWSPGYDFRAESVQKGIDIIYKAKIYQRTGQNWNDVQLYVSTYKPNPNQNRPILTPMYVTEAQPLSTNSNYTMNQSLSHANSYQLAEKKQADEYEIPAANVEDQQLNLVYELKNSQSLKSQDKEQYVILDKKTVDATYKYHAVPKVNNNVFLMGFVKNWQNLNLLNAEASIYFEDNYIGKTMVNNKYLKDEFPISFGIDERIVLKRVKLENKNEEKTLSSNRKEIHTYSISIRNNKSELIDIEILDQIPLSEDNKIVVKALETGDADYDKSIGTLLWTRKIPAGKTEKITLSYEVKYPKDMNVKYYGR